MNTFFETAGQAALELMKVAPNRGAGEAAAARISASLGRDVEVLLQGDVGVTFVAEDPERGLVLTVETRRLAKGPWFAERLFEYGNDRLLAVNGSVVTWDEATLYLSAFTESRAADWILALAGARLLAGRLGIRLDAREQAEALVEALRRLELGGREKLAEWLAARGLNQQYLEVAGRNVALLRAVRTHLLTLPADHPALPAETDRVGWIRRILIDLGDSEALRAAWERRRSGTSDDIVAWAMQAGIDFTVRTTGDWSPIVPDIGDQWWEPREIWSPALGVTQIDQWEGPWRELPDGLKGDFLLSHALSKVLEGESVIWFWGREKKE